MFSPLSTPNSLRLRPPPLLSSAASLPSPTSPNLHSPRISPISAVADTTCFANATSPTAVLSPPSLYGILGISIEATGTEIKTAYRRLARTSHPDVNDSSSGEEFVKINAAYSTLSDPEKRADYDRRLFRSRSYGSGIRQTPAYGGYGGRNWETDQCW